MLPEFGTIELRRQFIAGLTALPLALRGLLGEPINLETLGGFLSWRVGNFLPVLLGLWPVIALSGMLAGEAAKGSLDLLAVDAAEPADDRAREGRRSRHGGGARDADPGRVDLAGRDACFDKLPGDEIPFSAALGQVVLYGVMMLASGAVAFATAPFLGRTRAMAFGLIVLFASYLIYSYASLSPVIDALKPLSFFDWTAGHRPMAGVSDWASVGVRSPASTSSCSRSACSRSSGGTSVASRTSGGSGCHRCRPGSPVRSAGSWRIERASRSPGASGSACTGSSSWRRPRRSATASRRCRRSRR